MQPERKRARVVESGSLENCYTRKGIGGSNPPASALVGLVRPKINSGVRG